MSKFKIGDRVIVIKDLSCLKESTVTEIGLTGIIKSTRTSHRSFDVTVRILESKMDYGYNDDNLELEQIFHSPLYQALR